MSNTDQNPNAFRIAADRTPDSDLPAAPRFLFAVVRKNGPQTVPLKDLHSGITAAGAEDSLGFRAEVPLKVRDARCRMVYRRVSLGFRTEVPLKRDVEDPPCLFSHVSLGLRAEVLLKEDDRV